VISERRRSSMDDHYRMKQWLRIMQLSHFRCSSLLAALVRRISAFHQRQGPLIAFLRTHCSSVWLMHGLDAV